jgi:cytochrome c oxidase subunit 4
VSLHRAFSSTSAVNSELTVEQKNKYYPKLGNRDIVGSGHNGLPIYVDNPDFPAPAVRFAENTPEVVALRTKEKGSWKELTLEEKKALYRANFRMTYAEINAPTGEWKSILAGALLGLSITGWMMIWMKQYVYPELPHTITEEWKINQAKKMIIERQGPVDGTASKFDYENNKWK